MCYQRLAQFLRLPVSVEPDNDVAFDMDLERYRFAITLPDGMTPIDSSEVGPRAYYDFGCPGHHATAAPGHTPIDRLPVEILRKIFIWVPILGFRESMHEFTMSLWTSSSQVCSRWRRITLKTAEFWTFLPLHTRHSKWKYLALERAYPKPISFFLDPRMCDQDWYLRAAGSLARCGVVSFAREVYLGNGDVIDYAFPSDFIGEIVRILDYFSAPMLEVLDVASQWSPSTVPGFVRELPSLRTLRITDSSLIHTSDLFTAQLTHLELHNCEDFPLTAALRHLPSLQTLIISDTCDVDLELVDEHKNTVSLPNLLKLELRDDYQACLAFMNCVDLPSNAEIDIHCYEQLTEATLTPVIMPLLQMVSDHLCVADVARIHFQTLSITAPNGLRDADCAFAFSHPTLSHLSLAERMAITYSWGSDFPNKTRLIIRFLVTVAAVIHRGIDRLNVKGVSMRYRDVWKDASVFIDKVSHIDVEGSAAQGLILALSVSPKGTPGLVIFPVLELINFERAIFTDRIDERPAPIKGQKQRSTERILAALSGQPLLEDQASGNDDGPTLFDELSRALKWRASNGYTLRRLVIRNCHLSAEMVPALQGFLGADAVDWDGRLKGSAHSWAIDGSPVIQRGLGERPFYS